jgi:hypothetical protein
LEDTADLGSPLSYAVEVQTLNLSVSTTTSATSRDDPDRTGHSANNRDAVNPG